MKLLLVDGYYYAYRSFHALIGLTNAHGEPAGAVFGFLKALRRMQRDLNPDRAAVVWDQGMPARRTELLPEYKAQREALAASLARLDAIKAGCQRCAHFDFGKCAVNDGAQIPAEFISAVGECEDWNFDLIPF